MYAATSSTVIDDVTKLVMYRIFNTNLEYYGSSFTHILTSVDAILLINTSTVFLNLSIFAFKVW